MDQAIRNKLRNVVTQCRKLLEEAVAQVLQGQFGIHASGKKDEVHVEDEARMNNLSEEDKGYRRDILAHLEHIEALGYKPKDALAQLVREIAFTHLNRLCAYKMMEAREVWVGGQRFREAVSRGLKSQGFQFYLADHSEDKKRFDSGHQDVAYRHFLAWLGALLSEEIGVLFSPTDPANRLFPTQRVLDDVLALLNSDDLKDIWSLDETIGWVYQYFTPKELRDQARKESAAPRNSYELAFRNQFFTPRYVVEFLTDNTLGRIWYEMRKGDTKLKDQCRYMVRRPVEVFEPQMNTDEHGAKKKEENNSPSSICVDPSSSVANSDLSREELLKQPVHIPHRPKKDPRELRILDPACGSGHFLLYCFDLLLTIYEEAYADPDLGLKLREEYPTLDALRRDVPRLILDHNLHGIDIDLRCTQIAALALWLRCQRAYREMGLKQDRPKITRSNIVCAEPMPGEKEMLDEFLKTLKQDRLEALIRRVMQVPEGSRVRATESMVESLTELVRLVWDKMRLAGEAGSLLKIEEELQEAVRKGQEEWEEKQPLFRFTEFSLTENPKESYVRFVPGEGVSFWQRAEALVLEALRDYARHAAKGGRLQRQLFADDAAQGFAFIDICQKQFDVVLMNPPFGDPPDSIKGILNSSFDEWNHNILCAFIARASASILSQGTIGVVFDRTASIKTTYEGFRHRYFLTDMPMVYVADLGWNVLDANVEVSACILSKSPYKLPSGNRLLWGSMLTLVPVPEKDRALEQAATLHDCSHSKFVPVESLAHLPNAVIDYFFEDFVLRIFSTFASFEQMGMRVIQGHTIKSDEFFRYFWELPEGKGKGLSGGGWARLYNGGSYSRFCMPLVDVVRYGDNGADIAKHDTTIFRNLSLQQRAGAAFGKRGDFIDAHYLPAGFVSTVEGQACLLPLDLVYRALAVLNSRLFQYVINQYCGQHKYAGYVNLFPLPNWNSACLIAVGQICSQIIDLKEMAMSWDETSPTFRSPTDGLADLQSLCTVAMQGQMITNRIHECEVLLNQNVFAAYGITDLEQLIVQKFCASEPSDSIWFDANVIDVDAASIFCANRLISYMVGITLGRWDVRKVLKLDAPIGRNERFSALPICSPGMLQDDEGFPLTRTPEDYPLRINWDGVIPDDPDHSDDIVRRLREVLELIWKDRAEAIEKEACDVLGVKELRDYFRKPGKGGFWDDHVSRYSKSRRKAPIYWLLQSSKKNYALWLYYHRLDKDMLFKALLNYVEPKIRLEQSRLDTLRAQKSALGDDAKGARKVAKDIERQEALLGEVKDFEEKLRRAANLDFGKKLDSSVIYDPDLNDGVVLNIAPLWELVPWKEAKGYWDELLAGEYEWSSMGKLLRKKGLVK